MCQLPPGIVVSSRYLSYLLRSCEPGPTHRILKDGRHWPASVCQAKTSVVLKRDRRRLGRYYIFMGLGVLFMLLQASSSIWRAHRSAPQFVSRRKIRSMLDGAAFHTGFRFACLMPLSGGLKTSAWVVSGSLQIASPIIESNFPALQWWRQGDKPV